MAWIKYDGRPIFRKRHGRFIVGEIMDDAPPHVIESLDRRKQYASSDGQPSPVWWWVYDQKITFRSLDYASARLLERELQKEFQAIVYYEEDVQVSVERANDAGAYNVVMTSSTQKEIRDGD